VSRYDNTLIDTENVEPAGEYRQYGWRFVVLIGFSLGTAINAVCWLSSTPIIDQMKESYDMSELFTTFCGLVFMLTYVFFGFAATYIIQTYGLKWTVWLGVGLTFIGMWIKTLIKVSKWFMLLGNTFGGLGQPFFLNSSALLAATWFSEQNRAMATTIAAMANNVGNVVASLFPTFFVSENNTKEENRDKIQEQYLYQAIMVSGVLLYNLIFMRAAPPTPPSESASVESTPFKQGMLRMIRNK
jgi:FLVCR family feline leukemia virus subgroup C receptor-related protein